MKRKILIVENDKTFCDALTRSLGRDFSVLVAEDGKTAKSILSIEDVSLVLSDVQMPFFSGLELLEWINHNKSCPVILMTGFSTDLEEEKAMEMGAGGYFRKPFAREDLLSKIDELVKPAPVTEEPEKHAQEIEFFKVPVEDFVSERETACALYLKLRENKYVKIAHKGGKIPDEKIDLFKTKGISHLYVHKKDFAGLVGFSLQLTKALANSKIDPVKKARFLTYTGELLSQQIFSEDLDQEACYFAKEFIQSSVDIIASDDDLTGILIDLKDHVDFLYAHSLAVSAISVLIAKKMGWTSSTILFKLAFSGLFHDIGKKELPKELLTKARYQLTAQDRKLFESHTVRGKEILESIRNAPAEAVYVAFEHHENYLSNGYPRAVSQSNLHPFTKVISVADSFCNYAVVSTSGVTTMSPADAIMKMKSKLYEMDKIAFTALSELLAKKQTA